MAKLVRNQKRVKSKHRAVKPRTPRPLDVAKPDNHAARHEAKKAAAELARLALVAKAKAAAEAAETAQLEADLAALDANPTTAEIPPPYEEKPATTFDYDGYLGKASA